MWHSLGAKVNNCQLPKRAAVDVPGVEVARTTGLVEKTRIINNRQACYLCFVLGQLQGLWGLLWLPYTPCPISHKLGN